MRIAVLGGGVVGVTTAYQLLKDGHEVVLVERRAAVGDETSWGNAGMIAPGHSFVWSSPRAPMVLLKSLFLKDQALRFRPSADPRLWSWSLKFLAQCTHERARVNTLRKHRLCLYSQRVLHETLDELAAGGGGKGDGIDYDRNTRGILYFYRSEERLAAGVEHMRILSDDGQRTEVLDRDAVIRLEPSLAEGGSAIAGGIYCPTDETGDCGKFTKALAEACRRMGAEIRTGTDVVRIDTDGDRIAGVATSMGPVTADAYVLALGNYSPVFARRLGIPLAVYPIKGYSMTIPVGNHQAGPTVGSVDEDNLVAISRFGDRVRVTATAEFAGYDTSHRPQDFDFMLGVVRGLYPDGADYDRAEGWAGLRPMTPEGTPRFGRRKYGNLWINSGHGHMGWTMSHASARITADLIAGRETAVPLDGMTV
ncbi:D-amino acid dehydrogenase [Thalassobaculum sp.]|uniref:D-amino acid dehydrogenase n=1 Tax=Thalassobaculum sp. TaxID=2022740 RepID=UPI0032EEA31C